MSRIKSKTFNIKIKCPRCGKEGKIFIRVRNRAKMCYVVHYEEGSTIRHSISCLDLLKMGINVDELVKEITHVSKT